VRFDLWRVELNASGRKGGGFPIATLPGANDSSARKVAGSNDGPLEILAVRTAEADVMPLESLKAALSVTIH
jgi:hypothetical protein